MSAVNNISSAYFLLPGRFPKASRIITARPLKKSLSVVLRAVSYPH
jgi:hypothetical protein